MIEPRGVIREAHYDPGSPPAPEPPGLPARKCPECGTALEFDRGSYGHREEPPTPAGWYCPSCGIDYPGDGRSDNLSDEEPWRIAEALAATKPRDADALSSGSSHIGSARRIEQDLGVPPLTDAQIERLAAALKPDLAPVVTAIEDAAEVLADSVAIAATSLRLPLRERAALIAWEQLCRVLARDVEHHADYETLAREAWQAADAFVAEGKRHTEG